MMSAYDIEHARNSYAGCKECIQSGQHWLCNSNNELCIGYKESVIDPYTARNKELKTKYEDALSNYKILKAKYDDAVNAYQKLKRKLIESSK